MTQFCNYFIPRIFAQSHNFTLLQLPGDILRAIRVLATCEQVRLDNCVTGNFTHNHISAVGFQNPVNAKLPGFTDPRFCFDYFGNLMTDNALQPN